MTDEELQQILRRIPSKESNPPQTLRLGGVVRIKSGAFQFFTGKIERINQTKALLRIVVMIFDQTKIIRLNLSDVEELSGA